MNYMNQIQNCQTLSFNRCQYKQHSYLKFFLIVCSIYALYYCSNNDLPLVLPKNLGH